MEEHMDGGSNRRCPCLWSLWDRMRSLCNRSEKGNEELERRDADSKPDNVPPVESRYIAEPSATPVPPEESTVYMALWGFKAGDTDDMSFEAGDRFRIVKRGGDWYTVDKLDVSGRVLATGVVPHNYLERAEAFTTQPWFFGKMNRIECHSHLLTSQNRDGAFLVRFSETDNVGQVLSVKEKNKAKHFKIYRSNNEFYLRKSCQFNSLLELVQHYQTHPLSSLGTLGKPCVKRKPKQRDLSHTTVDKWELPKEDFTLEEKLGSGFFADVYRGLWKNQTNVAIKILKNHDSLNQTNFQLEVEALKKLRHHQLISLFAICTSSAPYYIITEYMEKGNLLDFLRSQEGSALDIELLTDMAFQVADGMTFLEQNNSIHRDLAARNVLVSEGYLCKVADFGLARFIKEPIYVSNDKKIPYKWTAPEAIQHGRFSNKSDVWSFGILLYEIYSYGATPYPGMNKKEALEETKRGYRMPAPSKCPPRIYQIMQSCWREEPEDRPSFKSLKAQLQECIA